NTADAVQTRGDDRQFLLERLLTKPLSQAGLGIKSEPLLAPSFLGRVFITYVVGPAKQAPRGQAALNGAAPRISASKHRPWLSKIRCGCHEWIFLLAASAFCRWRRRGNRLPNN